MIIHRADMFGCHSYISFAGVALSASEHTRTSQPIHKGISHWRVGVWVMQTLDTLGQVSPADMDIRGAGTFWETIRPCERLGLNIKRCCVKPLMMPNLEREDDASDKTRPA